MSFFRIHRTFRVLPGVLIFLFLQVAMLYCADGFTFVPVRPLIVSARTAGFGGSYSALEAGFDTLTTNPAALAFVKEEWSISRLAMEVSGPLFDLPSIMEADDITTSILDLVAKNNGVYIGANITGPISFGKVDKNFGFGIFNRSMTKADVPSLAHSTLLVGEEILFVGGYGLTVFEKGPHSLSFGLQMKGFFQTFLYESGTSISVINSAMSLDVNTIPTILSTGFGVDVGLMYRKGTRFNAAITCKDVYTPVFSTNYLNLDGFMAGDDIETLYARLSPDLSAGIVYSIPVPSHWATLTGWNVMADYRDALDFLNPLYRNPILNIAVGTEIILLNVVSLRAGISDAYLSSGLGLDLSVCQLDFAMYGSELGIDPGKRPLLNIALSLSFQY